MYCFVSINGYFIFVMSSSYSIAGNNSYERIAEIKMKNTISFDFPREKTSGKHDVEIKQYEFNDIVRNGIRCCSLFAMKEGERILSRV